MRKFFQSKALKVLLFTLFGWGVGFLGISHQLPHLYFHDETYITNLSFALTGQRLLGQPTWNTQTTYPALIIYLNSLGQEIYYHLGNFFNYEAFAKEFYLFPTNFYLIGRSISALCLGLLSGSFFYLGSLLFSELTAAAAAILLTTTPIVINQAHYVVVDVPLLLTLVLGLLAIFNYEKNPSLLWLILGAVFTGLGLGIKYPASASLIMLLFYLILKQKEYKVRRLFLAGFTISLVFLLTNPFFFPHILKNITNLKQSFTTTRSDIWGFSGHLTALFQFSTQFLGKTISWPIYFLTLIGLWGIYKRKPAIFFLLALYGVSSLIFLTVYGRRHLRCLMPVLPVTCLAAAFSIEYFSSFRIINRFISYLLAFFLLLLILPQPIASMKPFLYPDIRPQVTSYLEKTYLNAIIAREDHHILDLTSPADLIELASITPPIMRPAMLKSYSKKPLFDILDLTWDEELYNLKNYQNFDLIVISSLYKDMLKDTPLFPDITSFYQELAAKWKLVKTFTPQRGESGPAIYIYQNPSSSIHRQNYSLMHSRYLLLKLFSEAKLVS